MAAALAAPTAEIAFFLQIRHSAFYCPFRFTNSGSKLLLRDGGICYHGLQHGQLFQRAIQSAILALLYFIIGTLNYCVFSEAHMETAILQFMLRTEKQVFKKHFEKLACSMDTFLQIVVVGSDKRIAEIP